MINKILINIRFKNPIQSDILIYDKNGENIIRDAVLNGNKYTVLHVRGEKYFISVRIIINMMKKYRILRNNTKSKIAKNIKEKLRQSYYLSYIEIANPKIIIAFIDNSYLFFNLSRYYKKAQFIAIQNGTRAIFDLNRGKVRNFYRSIIFSFGNWEKDLFRKYGINTANVIPIGSIKGGYYKYELSKIEEKKYDICLISQFRERIIFGNDYSAIKENITRLSFSLSKFHNKNNHYSLCVACNSAHDLEINYYKKYFPEAFITKNFKQRRGFLTYKMMDMSDVLLTFDSTAAFEAFGWGKKVLFCNFVGIKDRYYPLPEMCSINTINYEIFNKKLTNLLTMDYNEYGNKCKDYFKYFVNCDPFNPPHHIIGKTIDKILNDKNAIKL